jgi:hypothetical protein
MNYMDNKLALMQHKIRDESGNTVLALSRLCLFHEANIAQIRTDMLKSKAGSKTRLDYLRALGKETREHTALIQSLGYFPRDLGISTVTHYEFKAVCGIGDSGYDPKPVLVPQIIDPPRLKP